MVYYLGIDAGGSGCRSRLSDAQGNILGEGETGPANTRIGLEALRERLIDVSMQAINAAGLDADATGEIRAAMGIAGINRMEMKTKLKVVDFPFSQIHFTSDAMIAHYGAHQGGDGAILILGTGSVALIRRGEDSFSIGGYGFPISDEGSGAALGLSAMRHALRALDGRSRPTALSKAVTAQFDHAIPKIIAWMDEATPANYASFAPLVMEYAENGDEIAHNIVHHAVLHVERFIETIFERGAQRVVLMGGLAPRIRPWLRDRTAVRLSEPLGDALDGALILAGRPLE